MPFSRPNRRLAHAAPRPEQGFTSSFTRVHGIRLHVRHRVADGPVWVLLHGLAVSHRYLMPTAVALPGSVYVPDLPGFGLSGRTRVVLDTGQHADVVAAWMDRAGLTGAYLLGNSFGCQVAVEMAIRRPDLITGLVQVGPTVDPRAPTAGAQFGRWLADLFREDPRQIPMMARDLGDAGLRRIVRTLGHAVDQRFADRLPLVGQPVLTLRGEHDPIVPPRWAAQAAALVAGPVGEVPGVAHNAITTAGRAVAARAVEFRLEAVPAGR